MTKTQKEKTGVFAAGIMFITGIHMTIEDYLGLERYIVFLRNNWQDVPWYAGAFFALIGFLALLLALKHPAKDT